MNEITLMSFGYLYGLPEEADTVIGIRGLPNPYWVEALKQKTGLDPAVRDYVFSTPEARDFFQTTLSLLRQRIALYGAYESPLKTPLVLALGCSGGKHRSVSMAIRLAEALAGEGISVKLLHRDLYKLLEHSAGAVVYTRQAEGLRFVIAQHLDGHHGFPKGHIEGGESEADAALREIREEVGLTPRLIPGFRRVEFYALPGKPNTYKQVVYFLAEYENQTPVPQQTELQAAALLSLPEALAVLEHDSARRILREAYAFLKTNQY